MAQLKGCAAHGDVCCGICGSGVYVNHPLPASAPKALDPTYGLNKQPTQRPGQQSSGSGTAVVGITGGGLVMVHQFTPEYLLKTLKEDVANNRESEASAFFIERWLKRLPK